MESLKATLSYIIRNQVKGNIKPKDRTFPGQDQTNIATPYFMPRMIPNTYIAERDARHYEHLRPTMQLEAKM